MDGRMSENDVPGGEAVDGLYNSSELPEGNVHVAFSGGRTSGLMLRRLLDRLGGTLPENWKVVFANTGREFPQTMDFVQRCSDEWSVPITWVEFAALPRDDGTDRTISSFRVVDYESASCKGEPFRELIVKRRLIPSVQRRFCTSELKVLAAARYLRSIGWKSWTQALGIRADEKRRLRPSRDDAKWDNWYPLAQDGIAIGEVADFWKSNDFDLKQPNDGGKNWMGNCDGCFLKSEHSTAEFIRLFPERAKWWEEQEEWLKNLRGGNEFTFSGKPGGRRALREFVEAQPDWVHELSDEDSLYCQADHGECTG